MTISITDIEIATANLNSARAKRQLQDVFDELKGLFDQDPQNVQIRQLMESLADKEPGLTAQIRRVYETHGEQFRPEDPALEDLKKRIQDAVYAEDLPLVERLYAEYTAKGGKDLDTDRRVAGLRNKGQPKQQAGVPNGQMNIPFEVKRLKGEANSTMNRGLYPQAIELANNALKILHDQSVIEGNPVYEDLSKIVEEAMALRDAREQHAKGMELIRIGNWREAFTVYDQASNTFHQPYLEEQRDALRNALHNEKEILDEARPLITRTDESSIERILILIDTLKGLPSMLGMGTEDALPAAQKSMLEQLGDKLRRTKDMYLRDAKNALELAYRETNNTEANKILIQARSQVEFVKRLDETDESAGNLLQAINAEEQKRRLERESANEADRQEILRRGRFRQIGRWLAIILVAVVVIGLGASAYNTVQVNNSNSIATQFLLDASSTSLALTQNMHTESVAGTEKAEEANMTRTKAAQESQETSTAIVLTQTQAVLNANASATVSVIEATNQERNLQLTLAMQVTQAAGTAMVITQTQSAVNATATKEIIDITSTVAARPTATPTAPDYVCLGRTVYGVKLRISPRQDATQVGVIPKDSQVQIFKFQGSNPGWYQVFSPANNAGGWIYGDSLTVNNCPPSLYNK